MCLFLPLLKKEAQKKRAYSEALAIGYSRAEVENRSARKTQTSSEKQWFRKCSRQNSVVVLCLDVTASGRRKTSTVTCLVMEERCAATESEIFTFCSCEKDRRLQTNW